MNCNSEDGEVRVESQSTNNKGCLCARCKALKESSLFFLLWGVDGSFKPHIKMWGVHYCFRYSKEETETLKVLIKFP